MVILYACGGTATGPAAVLTYRISAGACGEVVFAETIGTDLNSALEVIEARKRSTYAQEELAIAPYPIEVVDEEGNPPEPVFYAVRVMYAGTEILFHSVVEVVNTSGALFHLSWCPD